MSDKASTSSAPSSPGKNSLHMDVLARPAHLWNLLIIIVSLRHGSRPARRHGRGVHRRVAVQRYLGAQLRILLQLLRGNNA